MPVVGEGSACEVKKIGISLKIFLRQSTSRLSKQDLKEYKIKIKASFIIPECPQALINGATDNTMMPLSGVWHQICEALRSFLSASIHRKISASKQVT